MNIYSILQAQVPLETVETLMHTQGSDGKSSLVIYILIIVIVNFLLNIVTFFMQKKLKDKEVEVDRKCLINKQSVEIESYVYGEFQKFSSFQKHESHELLDAIVNLQTYIDENHLYIRKKLVRICTEVIDYYSVVCADFKRKDAGKELKLLEKYKKAFYE